MLNRKQQYLAGWGILPSEPEQKPATPPPPEPSGQPDQNWRPSKGAISEHVLMLLAEHPACQPKGEGLQKKQVQALIQQEKLDYRLGSVTNAIYFLRQKGLAELARPQRYNSERVGTRLTPRGLAIARELADE